MSIWDKLFGKSGTSVSAEIPWDYSSPPSQDAGAFLSKYGESIKSLFKSYGSGAKDPIVLLVAYEQDKWRGLLHLLYQKKEQVQLCPEIFTGAKPQAENIGNNCWVYSPPKVKGQKLQTGIYVAERSWVVSELCRIQGIPLLFHQMVKDERTPGRIPVVVLTTGGMRVESLPA